MANYGININLLALKNATLAQIENDCGEMETCVCIPIKRNNLKYLEYQDVYSKKIYPRCYVNLIALQERNPNSNNSHFITLKETKEEICTPNHRCQPIGGMIKFK